MPLLNIKEAVAEFPGSLHGDGREANVGPAGKSIHWALLLAKQISTKVEPNHFYT